ncbi:hypothetical protein FOA52_014778 [Chlamydomonas sp. UWO 241]|nr:hypothetical protein FOA52_014778 [Chlamydomonas sp. UWO 241]
MIRTGHFGCEDYFGSIVDAISGADTYLVATNFPAYLEAQVAGLRKERSTLAVDPRFDHVVSMIRTGYFGWEDYIGPIVDAISGTDTYLVATDFPAYLEAQAQVNATYLDRAKWTRMSILSTAGMGKFSTDRTIAEYAKDIWGVEACVVPTPEPDLKNGAHAGSSSSSSSSSSSAG